MPADIKNLAVMIAGAIGGIYVIRKMDVMPEIFNNLTYSNTIVKAPELGLGRGKDNLPNTTYLIPAAVAVGAYFFL